MKAGREVFGERERECETPNRTRSVLDPRFLHTSTSQNGIMVTSFLACVPKAILIGRIFSYHISIYDCDIPGIHSHPP